MRFVLLASLASMLLACGGGTDTDGGAGGADAGPTMDSGGGDTDGGDDDGGVGIDAGDLVDAGGGVDAGDATDAGDTDAGDTDAGDTDAGDTDAGDTDAGGGTDAGGAMDAGGTDAGASDAGASDAGVDASTFCDAMDAMEGTPCGPTERPRPRYVWNGRSCEFAPWCRCLGRDCGEFYADEAACLAVYRPCLPTCAGDSDCPSGSEWCESGVCVPCDNSGLLCDIACSPRGWNTYMRNGCSPCDCGPPSECSADGDCRRGERCYAGDFCWCTGGGRSPDCCLGNICSRPGCPEPPPTGCATRGCPRGQSCVVGGGTCTSSSCNCGPGSTWGCTRDCGGGSCVP